MLLSLTALVVALISVLHLARASACGVPSGALTSSADLGGRFISADGHDHLRGSAEPDSTPELTGIEAEDVEEGSHLVPTFVTFPQLRFAPQIVLGNRGVSHCSVAPPRKSSARAALPRGPPAPRR